MGPLEKDQVRTEVDKVTKGHSSFILINTASAKKQGSANAVQ